MVGIWTAGMVQRVLSSKLQIITGQGCGHAFWLPFGKALATFTHKKKKARKGVCCSPCTQDRAPSWLTEISFPTPIWLRLGFMPVPICQMIASAGWVLKGHSLAWSSYQIVLLADVVKRVLVWHITHIPPLTTTHPPACWLITLSPFFLLRLLFLSLAVLKAFLVS